MLVNSTPGFLDQTTGRLVYALIPLNILLMLGHGATAWGAHREGSLLLYVLAFILLAVFWGIATVKLIARRRRKVLWRLIALLPPMAIVIGEPILANQSVLFLLGAFIVWSLASMSLGFLPDAAPQPAVHGR